MIRRLSLASMVCASLLSACARSSELSSEIDRSPSTREVSVPEGEIGERIRALLAMINAGDDRATRQFIENECSANFRNFVPMEEHVRVFAQLRRDSGGLDALRIRTEDSGAVLELADRSLGAAWTIMLGFEESAQRLVSAISFSPGHAAGDASDEALDERGLIAATRDLVQSACTQDAFSGAVLLARGDDIRFQTVCGEASKRFHVANAIDTKFNLGSMNKMFTATAIAQLVEQGKLGYDDRIRDHVDETWLPAELTEKVKIRHLLSHSSGLGNYFNETFQNGSRALYRDIDDFKPLLADERLQFEPGTSFLYSNSGMLLLGVVIESVTGGSYFEYIRKHVYAPAGMTDSDSYEMDDPVENLAIGYIPSDGQPPSWKNNLFRHVIKGGPAGGGYSTVADLHRFARALQRHELVSQSTLNTLWTDQSGTGYGFGFGVKSGPAGRVVGHSGGFPGLSADLSIFVDSGYIVVVLSNYGHIAARVAGEIRRYLARVKRDE